MNGVSCSQGQRQQGPGGVWVSQTPTKFQESYREIRNQERQVETILIKLPNIPMDSLVVSCPKGQLY